MGAAPSHQPVRVVQAGTPGAPPINGLVPGASPGAPGGPGGPPASPGSVLGAFPGSPGGPGGPPASPGVTPGGHTAAPTQHACMAEAGSKASRLQQQQQQQQQSERKWCQQVPQERPLSEAWCPAHLQEPLAAREALRPLHRAQCLAHLQDPLVAQEALQQSQASLQVGAPLPLPPVHACIECSAPAEQGGVPHLPARAQAVWGPSLVCGGPQPDVHPALLQPHWPAPCTAARPARTPLCGSRDCRSTSHQRPGPGCFSGSSWWPWRPSSLSWLCAGRISGLARRPRRPSGSPRHHSRWAHAAACFLHVLLRQACRDSTAAGCTAPTAGG